MGDTDTIQSLRAEIDRIDDRIVDLLAERLSVVRRVVAVKQRDDLPALIESRVDEVLAHVRDYAVLQDLPPDLAETVWKGLIEWTIRFEESELGGRRM